MLAATGIGAVLGPFPTAVFQSASSLPVLNHAQGAVQRSLGAASGFLCQLTDRMLALRGRLGRGDSIRAAQN